MDQKTVYFFFRDCETGITAEWIRLNGAEKTQERLKEQAVLQLSSEGLPLPEGVTPVVVLPDEWAGALEAPLQTPVDTLLDSIRWYFRQQGREVTAAAYACLGETGKPKQFWMGTHALLPVWVEAKVQQPPVSPAPAEEEKAPAPEEGTEESAQKAASPSGTLPEPRHTDAAMPWRDVYIFISSTFNDMHGERNYLVKRVFPALSQWCAAHRLRLRDIDLRWGITEEDSMENRRTVEICLANIDRCRPFFLCFIGQRRGWVPEEQDIAEKTFESFPKLKEKLGSSVTEMEVIHAMIDPMRRQVLSDADALTRAFFYLRDDSYLKDIHSDALLNIYTNRGSKDPARDDRLLDEFRSRTIPGTNRPCRIYNCRWDPDGTTPELGAVSNAPADLTKGALAGFASGGKPLHEIILEDLKAAIQERYMIAEDKPGETALSAELEQQSLFLHTAGESFIERAGDLDPFEEYVRSGSTKPLILTAPAGMGKSSLLAHWILCAPYQIYYRFIGRSDRAGTAAGLAYSIWEQLFEEGKAGSAPPEDAAALLEDFRDMLREAAEGHKLVLVIDAADQLPGGISDILFLPRRLPYNVKLILSVKEGSPGADRFLDEAAVFGEIVRVKPLSEMSDRSALADAYLSNYLKQLSGSQMDALIHSGGAANPLYLRIVLSELRVFGAYDTLQAHIEQDFGETPVTAFDAMLNRIEGDAPVSDIPMNVLAGNVFGWLGHTRYGLEVRELSDLLQRNGVCSGGEAAADTVHVLVRQLREFLTERDMRVDFFYDSFREASRRRYTKDKPSVQWHRELAEYFAAKPVDDPHSLLERAFQLLASEQAEAYSRYVLDYAYLAAQLAFGGVQGLMQDYALADTDETSAMTAFLGLAGPVLSDDPDQLPSRLLGHLGTSTLPAIRALTAQAEQFQKGAWLKPLTCCFEAPRSSAEKTFSSPGEIAASVALLRHDTLCAAVVDSRTILIRELSTGNVTGTIPAPDGEGFAQVAAARNGDWLVAGTVPLNLDGGPGRAEILVYETGRFACVTRFPVTGSYVCYQYYGIGHLREYQFSVTGDLLILPDSAHLIRAYRLTDGSVAAETKMYRWNASCAALSETGLAAVGNIHPQNSQDQFDSLDFERIDNPLFLFRMDEKNGTFQPFGKPMGAWKWNIQRVSISPDGRFAAACDGFRTLVYRTDTGELVLDLEQECANVLFLKQRNLLLAAGHGVALFDAATFELVEEYRGLGTCNAAAVSADERFAVLQTDNRKLRVLALTSGTGDRRSYSAPLPIRSVALSPDGKSVLASCYDNFVRRGKERTPGQSDDPRLFRFDRDTGTLEGRMRLCGRMNRDFTFLAPDGTMAVSKNFQDSEWYVFRSWDIPPQPDTGDELYAESFSRPKTGFHAIDIPSSMQFSADRRFLIIHDSAASASVCRAKTGRLLGTVTLKPPGTLMQKLFSKELYNSLGDAHFDVAGDGKILYVLFTDYEKPRLECYDVAKNRRLSSVMLPDGNPTHLFQTDYANMLVQAVAGGRKLAFVSWDAAVILDTETGRALFRLEKEEDQCTDDDFFAACSGDGRYLAVSGKRDGRDANWRLHLYDTETGMRLAAFVADGEIGEMRFEPDGETLLFGMGNGRICRLRVMRP